MPGQVLRSGLEDNETNLVLGLMESRNRNNDKLCKVLGKEQTGFWKREWLIRPGRGAPLYIHLKDEKELYRALVCVQGRKQQQERESSVQSRNCQVSKLEWSMADMKLEDEAGPRFLQGFVEHEKSPEFYSKSWIFMLRLLKRRVAENQLVAV